ncbi:MAG TPA: c-type cytochrome [Vicinamibacterales bacterium]|nr:c-type cytochrome [Vicinamibacterales bacterium]
MRVTSTPRWTLAAAAMLVAALGSAIGAQTRTQRPQGRAPERPPATPQGRGADPREAIARRLCSQCHPFEFVVAVRRTRAQWEATVENMIGRGARGTNAEFAAVIDYLSEAHVLTPSTVRGGSGPDDKPMVDPKAAEAAKPLYAANCLACHGADARGTPQGGNLVRSIVVLHDRYGSTLGPFLRGVHPPVPVPGKGGPPTAAAFEGLTSRDVLLLAHFLRDRINDTLRGAPMFKAGNVLVGEPRAGAEYFQGEGGCTQCHSPTGDLAGIGKRLEPVNLQQRFLFPQTARRQSTDVKVVTVTVTTDSGETLTGALDRMDDFNVSFLDASGNYRSVRRTPGTRVVKSDPFAAHVALLSRITDKNIHDVVAYLETLK